MNHVSAITSGFSIVSALMLLVAYLFFLRDMEKTRSGKIACVAVLLGLACLQIAHFLYFSDGLAILSFRVYSILLAFLPVAFFFFSREILFFGNDIAPVDVIHLLPIILALIIPLSFIPPMAFLVGAAYTFLFARKILVLRSHTGRFKFEAFFFVLFFLMALIALVLGLALPFLDHAVFYHAYANTISAAMLLVVSAFLIFPALLSDILLIAETTYAKSRLDSVDVDAMIRRLEQLMIDEKQYENENLSLANVAELLDLSSHQLSELINSHFGFGFPKFVREHRIRAAKKMLLCQPKASVLSVSLATGFRSQSSFYTAFKESTGVSPGNFRKQGICLRLYFRIYKPGTP